MLFYVDCNWWHCHMVQVDVAYAAGLRKTMYYGCVIKSKGWNIWLGIFSFQHMFSCWLIGFTNKLCFFSLLISNCTDALQDKKSLKLGPEDNLHLEGFALNVFAKADKQDRAGRADLYVKFDFIVFGLCSSWHLILVRQHSPVVVSMVLKIRPTCLIGSTRNWELVWSENVLNCFELWTVVELAQTYWFTVQPLV